ncbi:MAG: YARHG domain-containing protein [Proteobacteria bacterium]|nr:YARHG domain-containing protein [Pseudomonadota bacterium]
MGVDKFGNIVLFGGLDDEYSLLFLSPEKTMLRDWDPFESVQRMEFMAGNRFLEPESGPWKYLIGYLDEDSHLFFMVKTIKGLYFLECDYLQLLKEYYGSLTPRQLLILQSMVSARRGKAFEDSALQGFFGRQAWYRQNMDYSDGKLTRNDRKFIDFISLIIEEIHPDR